MLNTLPARPIAASYSAFRAPVASPSSISRRFGTGPFCSFWFKLHSSWGNAISVRRGAREEGVGVERSDDVGYEADRQQPAGEDADRGRADHGETGARVAAVLNAAEEAA